MEQAEPTGEADWEADLSPALRKDIHTLAQGEREQSGLLDCLWCELYGSINADFWAGCISEEQAAYLRAKYLHMGKRSLEEEL